MVAALGSPVDAAVRTSLKYPGPALAQHLVDHFRLFLAFEWSPGQAECMEDINPDGLSWTPKILSPEVQNELGMGFGEDPVLSLLCTG